MADPLTLFEEEPRSSSYKSTFLKKKFPKFFLKYLFNSLYIRIPRKHDFKFPYQIINPFDLDNLWTISNIFHNQLEVSITGCICHAHKPRKLFNDLQFCMFCAFYLFSFLCLFCKKVKLVALDRVSQYINKDI